VFHHAVDPDGSIHRYWLEAEQSDHKVGGAQRESKVRRICLYPKGMQSLLVHYALVGHNRPRSRMHSHEAKLLQL